MIKFDAGDWLKIKETLENQITQANMTITLNEVLLTFVEQKLEKLKLPKKPNTAIG